VLDNAHCEGEQFCAIFQDTNIDNLPACLSPLFPGQTFSNVPCTPICTNDGDSANPEVVQLGFDKLNVVTSPVHPLLTSFRSGHQQAFQHVDLGAVLVQHLDPHCKIMTANGVFMFKDKNIVNVSADPLSFTSTRVVPYLWVKSAAPHITSFLKGEISVQESLVMTVAEVLSTLPTSNFFASTFNLHVFLYCLSSLVLLLLIATCVQVSLRCRTSSSTRGNTQLPWFRLLFCKKRSVDGPSPECIPMTPLPPRNYRHFGTSPRPVRPVEVPRATHAAFTRFKPCDFHMARNSLTDSVSSYTGSARVF